MNARPETTSRRRRELNLLEGLGWTHIAHRHPDVVGFLLCDIYECVHVYETCLCCHRHSTDFLPLASRHEIPASPMVLWMGSFRCSRGFIMWWE